MSVIDNLKAARALISDPAKWTQEYFARDTNGNQRGHKAVVEKDPTCACFCMAGALHYIVGDNIDNEVNALGFKDGGLFRFNDEAIHADVLLHFDEAIARLEVEQSCQ